MNYNQIKQNLLPAFNQTPTNINLSGKLASAFMETRDFPGALAILNRAVAIRETEQTLTNLGYFLLYEGEPDAVTGRWQRQPDKAIEVLEKAVKLNPASHRAYSVLGEAYLEKERNHEAETVLLQGVNIRETGANLNNLGVALYRQNKYEQAIQYFDQAHQKRETHYSYRPYLNYALSLAKTGQKDEAIKTANDLLVHINNHIGEVNLPDITYLLYETGDHERATELAAEAFKTFTVDPDFFGVYTASLYAQNRLREAETFYQTTLCHTREQLEDTINDDAPDWDEDDRKARIKTLEEEMARYGTIYESVLSGTKIKIPAYLPHVEHDCYLFGCLIHHQE